MGRKERVRQQPQPGQIRCVHCWHWQDASQFVGKNGKPTVQCRSCLDEKYSAIKVNREFLKFGGLMGYRVVWSTSCLYKNGELISPYEIETDWMELRDGYILREKNSGQHYRVGEGGSLIPCDPPPSMTPAPCQHRSQARGELVCHSDMIPARTPKS